MKLSEQGLLNCKHWEEQGYLLPQYDRKGMIENTKKNPAWVHFGAGNLFRAFPALIQQDLLNRGLTDTGIIVAEGFDADILEQVYKPFDNLSVLAVLKADGTVEKKVVGSVAEVLHATEQVEADWMRLTEIFEQPTLKMASFTITEKGYSFTGDSSIIAVVTKLLYVRFLKNRLPLALVSMDNCSHNGEKLFQAVETVALRMLEEGTVTAEFLNYLRDSQMVSFPWSMIDKITPRPDQAVQEMLKQDGLEDTDMVLTAKNSYTAIFVNAEEVQYLVIEDAFPNGRPPLEQSGVYFTDRDTVNRVEKMKVCTCLNPLHTALALFGCLLGYESIHAEMNDGDLTQLLLILGYQEGMPVVVDPKIIDPMNFIHEVLSIRLPNPFMPDTPQRIATDTSQKLNVRFGETIQAYLRREDLSVQSLSAIPLIFAAWCRYLLGVDDDGNPFELSTDPMLPEILPFLKSIHLGAQGSFHEQLQPILSNKKIFGLDLYTVGLGEKTEGYFTQLVAGKKAVRKTLAALLPSTSV